MIYCLICKRIRGIGSNKPQPPLFGRETGHVVGYISRLLQVLIHRIRDAELVLQVNIINSRRTTELCFTQKPHPSFQQTIMLFTAFTFVAALVGGAYAAPASSRTVISAPQGRGQIIVSQTQLRVTGCLNAAGLWNVAGDCATFTGDEEGGISGPEGYLVLTEDSITTSTSSDTTWLGYYLNGNVSAQEQVSQIRFWLSPCDGHYILTRCFWIDLRRIHICRQNHGERCFRTDPA
jgi:hypothetical protein